MPQIQVLSPQVAELIAAGEVVERPASIVKELLENAVDAGAGAITVEIRGGGVRYIRVTDDGCGIPATQVETAFLRHATSKLSKKEDLEHIATLGFRGEALASIAAVSKVELTTKTADSDLGVTYSMPEGECSEVGCPDGTTVIVRDLFYNVPARLKFLKKDTTETAVIGGIVEKLALSHPEISFRFISDQKPRLHTPGDGNLLNAISATFGREFAAGLIPVRYSMNGYEVAGYLSTPDKARINRNMQHFFVNGRYVKSRTCVAAVEQGCKNVLMTGKFPACVLNVTVPFDSVDVNVHPAKTEVRFIDERSVFDTVYFGIKSALGADDILKKPVSVPPVTMPAAEQAPKQQTFIPDPPKPVFVSEPVKPKPVFTESVTRVETNTLHAPQAVYQVAPVTPEPERKPAAPVTLVIDQNTGEVLEPATPHMPEPTRKNIPEPAAPGVPEPEPLPTPKIIGEAFGTYLLFEAGDRLYLLDKHAAHERLLYEKLKKSISSADRQVLLHSIPVVLTREELRALEEAKVTVEQLGFSFDAISDNRVLLREIPLVLSDYPADEIFTDLAQRLLEQRRDLTGERFEHLLHSMACRMAVKAHDPSALPELEALLQAVYADDEIRNCPHGRPILVCYTKRELEKKFGRI